MPDTPLSFIGTGMRFITWTPADEASSARCSASSSATASSASRSSTRPTTPGCGGSRSSREEDVEEIVIGLAYSVGEVHCCMRITRSAPPPWPTAQARQALPQGSRRAVDAGRRAGAGAALHRRRPGADSQRLQPLHGRRARAVRVHGGTRAASRCCTRRSARWRAARRSGQSRRLRSLEAEGCRRLDEDALAAVAEHFAALAEEQGLPSAVRRSSTRPTTAINWPAAWSRLTQRMLEELR